MVLWRISNHSTLNGKGGLVSSARWHTQGRRIVYLAQTPAGALIEAIVHLELIEELLPDDYQLLKVQVPDTISRNRIDPSSLPANWPDDLKITRGAGDLWLEQASSALLEVPSVIVPETANWLLNPEHADAPRCTIEWGRRFAYDRRLLHRTTGPQS